MAKNGAEEISLQKLVAAAHPMASKRSSHSSFRHLTQRGSWKVVIGEAHPLVIHALARNVIESGAHGTFSGNAGRDIQDGGCRGMRAGHLDIGRRKLRRISPPISNKGRFQVDRGAIFGFGSRVAVINR